MLAVPDGLPDALAEFEAVREGEDVGDGGTLDVSDDDDVAGGVGAAVLDCVGVRDGVLAALGVPEGVPDGEAAPSDGSRGGSVTP